MEQTNKRRSKLEYLQDKVKNSTINKGGKQPHSSCLSQAIHFNLWMLMTTKHNTIPQVK